MGPNKRNKIFFNLTKPYPLSTLKVSPDKQIDIQKIILTFNPSKLFTCNIFLKTFICSNDCFEM